jgi:nucleoside 2-deoxyribosyltransferase
MSTTKAQNDSNAQKQKVSFPRETLAKALTLAQAIKEKNGGNPWSSEQAADAVEMGRKSNNFFYLCASARDYGLTKGGRETEMVELQPLGREIVYASNADVEASKKREAFLRVELFKKVLDYYKGANLPEMKYLGNTLENTFGLTRDRHEEFSKVFQANCEYVGITTVFSASRSEPVNFTLVEDQTNIRPTTVTLAEPNGSNGSNSGTAFVIIPFVERDSIHTKGFFQEALRNLITPAARDAGFIVKTANRQGSDVIQSTIINDLINADLVIADLTEHNPNVLFELGIRIAQKKPVALIKAAGTGRIFDVDSMIRVFEYQATLWKSSIESDLPGLTDHIRGTWEKRENTTSYMEILLKQSEVAEKIQTIAAAK